MITAATDFRSRVSLQAIVMRVSIASGDIPVGPVLTSHTAFFGVINARIAAFRFDRCHGITTLYSNLMSIIFFIYNFFIS